MSDALTKAKHLDGPWSYTFDHDGDHAIFSNAGRLIAITDGIHDLPLEIDEANARLIAAAPELLEQAKISLAALELEYGRGCSPQLEAAIKKAEGA